MPGILGDIESVVKGVVSNGATAAAPVGGAAVQKAAAQDVAPVEAPVDAAKSALDATKDIWATLSSENLWIRVAKIVIGGTLVIIGVSKMTGISNAVTQVAEKVPL